KSPGTMSIGNRTPLSCSRIIWSAVAERSGDTAFGLAEALRDRGTRVPLRKRRRRCAFAGALHLLRPVRVLLAARPDLAQIPGLSTPFKDWHPSPPAYCVPLLIFDLWLKLEKSTYVHGKTFRKCRSG